ncbi:MAG: polyhydroxyalkanoate synthesis regulator [Thermodesulfobacteriota bacterium]
MFELFKKTIWLGAGLAVMTTEKIEEAVAEIIKKGQLSEKEGKELMADLVEQSKKAKRKLAEKVEKIINHTLQKMNIPSRKEMEELRARVARLEKGAKKEE